MAQQQMAYYQELDTVADMAKLAVALRHSGYPTEAVQQIMGGNWRRFLERTLPTADTI